MLKCLSPKVFLKSSENARHQNLNSATHRLWGFGGWELHELAHDVDGDGEDDGAVVLRRDAVEGLQVSQLWVDGVRSAGCYGVFASTYIARMYTLCMYTYVYIVYIRIYVHIRMYICA